LQLLIDELSVEKEEREKNLSVNTKTIEDHHSSLVAQVESLRSSVDEVDVDCDKRVSTFNQLQFTRAQMVHSLERTIDRWADSGDDDDGGDDGGSTAKTTRSNGSRGEGGRGGGGSSGRSKGSREGASLREVAEWFAGRTAASDADEAVNSALEHDITSAMDGVDDPHQVRQNVELVSQRVGRGSALLSSIRGTFDDAAGTAATQVADAQVRTNRINHFIKAITQLSFLV
jgi:hypothetical protein